MTHRIDVAESRDHDLDVGARWRVLAERRLEHLTELFESGRWRRYYSERAFLENIQEAKAAVALWRNLSMPQPLPPQAGKLNGDVAAQAAPVIAQAAPIIVQAAPIIVQAKAVVEINGAEKAVASDEMLPAPAPAPPVLDEKAAQAKATEARFALLRNML